MSEIGMHQMMGRLYTPANRNRICPDLPWAIDNGAFSGFDSEAFLRLLDRAAGTPGCLWVAAPDVVGDAEATLANFIHWHRPITQLGFPIALVAQDGLTVDAVPWHALDAIFVGGTTNWKLGREAEEVVREAKHRGKLAHMGRVNSFKRMQHAYDIGCDSIDGTKFSMYGDTYLRQFLGFAERLRAQGMLWGERCRDGNESEVA